MESQIKNFSSFAFAIYMLKHSFFTMRPVLQQTPYHPCLSMQKKSCKYCDLQLFFAER